METGTTSHDPAGTPSGDVSDQHKVLLVADELFRGRDLARELQNHLDLDAETVDVMVVSPAISHSTLDQELGNVDKALPEAGDRMVAIVEELNEAGFHARGMIGDADPLVAIDDGLAEYPADEIIAVVHTESEKEPAERNIWNRLSTDFHQPVTMIEVTRPASGAISGVVNARHAPSHERTEEEVVQATRNFPELKRRDMAGILIGFIGTVALGMIAVAAGTKDGGELSGAAAVILLIAMGAFLINVAHIVGLLFFESVHYTGIWERFMARMSIVVTAVGLAVSLVLWLTM